jgi:hypothetical protein
VRGHLAEGVLVEVFGGRREVRGERRKVRAV